MWTVDATQHIHVEPNVPEREVLERATAVARQSAADDRVFLDLFARADLACACNPPAHWKAYQVILYAPEGQKRASDS